jgi:hypothetical protein
VCVCDNIPKCVLFIFLVYVRQFIHLTVFPRQNLVVLIFFFILSSYKSTQAYSFSSVSVFSFQKPVFKWCKLRQHEQNITILASSIFLCPWVLISRIISRRTLIIQLILTITFFNLNKLFKIDHYRLSKWGAIIDIPLTSAVEIFNRLISMKTSCCCSFSPYLTENSLRHKKYSLKSARNSERTAQTGTTNHGEKT